METKYLFTLLPFEIKINKFNKDHYRCCPVNFNKLFSEYQNRQCFVNFKQNNLRILQFPRDHQQLYK